ncbi:hypothetical protein [Carboxylicivirga linearis]|uniref:Lipocalin-like domain-containing protein n=1 Tax=Carboxylicivirga linearis TaxID=1628157 RepID=A0ABS5JZD5_9BACT|nr:hypothetical protein [Carboxylicivirga linearis]MBS2100267.1 hypothetical protein [Carboxylicivirga linearis]
MKKNSLVVLMATILISTFFSSCSKSDDMKGKEIIGAWELVTETVSWGRTVTTTELMVFNADETGSMTTYIDGGWGGASSEAYNFTYTFDGTSLFIDAEDFSRTTDAFVEDGVLTIEVNVNGETFQREYTKITKEELEQREEERKQQEEEQEEEEEEDETQVIIEQLIGEWIWSVEVTDPTAGYDLYNDIIIFYEDKTGVYREQWLLDGEYVQNITTEFEFDVEGDILKLDFDGAVYEYQVAVDGNELTLTVPSDGVSNTYTRTE